MTVIKYDNSDVESGGSGTQPQPAVYSGKIVSVTDRRPDKNDMEVVVDLGPDYARIWSYVNFGDASKWKFREFTDALGLKAKGQFDTSKLAGKKVNVKITADSYEGEYKGRIGRWLKPGSENGDEAEELEEEPTARGNGASAVADEEELDPELVEDLHTDAAEYEDWDDDDIKSYFDDLGLEMSGRKTRKKMIAAIVEFAEEREGSGEAEEDKEPDDDYPTWTLDELKEEVKDRNDKADAEISIVGRPTKDKLIDALREDDKKEPF